MDKLNTKEKVHNRGCDAVGKTMLELSDAMDKKASGSKSQVGDAWESWFGVSKNNIAGPDLPEAGVELKATGVKDTSNGKSAKERLVLNIINYIDEYDKEFETSSFWNKNRFMELGFYGYKKDESWLNWEVLKSVLFTYPVKDLLIIRKDWETIHDYIKNGRAHELSESLTMYLGACPKGANRSSVRDQHPTLNAPKAMQRAYSLKSTYITYLLREYIFGKNTDGHIRVKPFEYGESFEASATYSDESIVKEEDVSILKNNTLEQYITDRLSKHIGKSVDELSSEFKVKKDANGKYPKAINAMLVSRILGVHGDLGKTEEFFKANIEVKTIQVNAKGTIKENMSFPAFRFEELVNESWDESTLRDMLDSDKFFFVVFKTLNDGTSVFKGAKFWSMPEHDIDTTVKDAWLDTVETLLTGVKLTYTGSRIENNFVKSGDRRIIHVRPHASKASYKENNPNAAELPVSAKWTNKPKGYSNNWMTKQSFWLNNDYILEQIKDLL